METTLWVVGKSLSAEGTRVEERKGMGPVAGGEEQGHSPQGIQAQRREGLGASSTLGEGVRVGRTLLPPGVRA